MCAVYPEMHQVQHRWYVLRKEARSVDVFVLNILCFLSENDPDPHRWRMDAPLTGSIGPVVWIAEQSQ